MGFNGNRIRKVQVNVQVEGKFVWKRGEKCQISGRRRGVMKKNQKNER